MSMHLPQHQHRYGIGALLLIVTFFLITGMMGLDFGTHWDERPNILDPLQSSIERGVLLPQLYKYPSVPYDLSALSLLPSMHQIKWSDRLDPSIIQHKLVSVVQSNEYLLRTRTLFLVITSLIIVWTFFLMGRWQKNVWQACLAAAFVGCSWEIAYHARWIAPDLLMAQFGMLCLLCLFFARDTKKPLGWLIAAAVVAGLACGSKYPGGIFLLMVIAAPFALFSQRPTRKQYLIIGATIAIVFVASYLLSTPGTLLDPARFLRDVLYQMRLYKSGHGGYTVHAGFEHLSLIVSYVALNGLSPFAPIALLLFGISLYGMSVAWRLDRPATAFLLAFMILYTLYFATQVVMVVRNYLILLPLIAIFTAIGLRRIIELLAPRRWAVATVITTIIATLLANAGWLFVSAASVRNENPEQTLLQFQQFALSHPDRQIYATPLIRAQFAHAKAALPPNITTSPGAPETALYMSEAGAWDWLANAKGYAHAIIGPNDVNFDYYPSWVGLDRIVILSKESADNLGALNGVHHKRRDWLVK